MSTKTKGKSVGQTKVNAMGLNRLTAPLFLRVCLILSFSHKTRLHSHSNRQRHQEPLFSYIDNSLEISIFGDCDAITRDFPKDLCPGLEVSSHIYRALQVDNGMIIREMSSVVCTPVKMRWLIS